MKPVTNTASKPEAAVEYLNVLSVEEYEDAKGQKQRSWTKVGVAYPTKDGQGFTIQLRAFPIDGRLVVLPPRNDDDNRKS